VALVCVSVFSAGIGFQQLRYRAGRAALYNRRGFGLVGVAGPCRDIEPLEHAQAGQALEAVAPPCLPGAADQLAAYALGGALRRGAMGALCCYRGCVAASASAFGMSSFVRFSVKKEEVV